VLPRTNHATMWSGDSGMYLKQGLYKMKSSTFPGGRSVIYFGPTSIGYTRPSGDDPISQATRVSPRNSRPGSPTSRITLEHLLRVAWR
jgi:hypothetical protein